MPPKFRIPLLDHVPNIYKYCKFINTAERRKTVAKIIVFYSPVIIRFFCLKDTKTKKIVEYNAEKLNIAIIKQIINNLTKCILIS